MYVFQHPETKVMLGVLLQESLDAEAQTFLKEFNADDIDMTLMVLSKSRAQSLYDILHAHYSDNNSVELYNKYLGEHRIGVNNIKDYELVSLKEAIQ